MRRPNFLCSILSAVALLNVPFTSIAELQSKSDLLTAQYQKARKQGLTRLNKQYIDLYEKEFEKALSARKLEEANAIRKRIDALKTENIEMSKVPEEEEKEFSILGKVLFFPHERQADFTVRVEFNKDGEAIWIGLGNVEATWVYEQGETPLIYYFGGDKLYRADINPDGKTATITKRGTSIRLDAKVKRSR